MLSFLIRGVNGKYMRIFWGDDTSTRLTFNGDYQEVNKTYSISGEYEIKFLGDFNSVIDIVSPNNNLSLFNVEYFSNLKNLYLDCNVLTTTSINDILIKVRNMENLSIYNQTPNAVPSDVALHTFLSNNENCSYDFDILPFNFRFSNIDNNISLPITYEENFLIDWDDGNGYIESEFSFGKLVHTYTDDNYHHVKFSGNTISILSINDLDIREFHSNNFENLKEIYFENCNNLIVFEIEKLYNIEIFNIISASSVWSGTIDKILNTFIDYNKYPNLNTIILTPGFAPPDPDIKSLFESTRPEVFLITD